MVIICGIAGFSLSELDQGKVNSKRLGRSLLLDIEHRGHDATGFAFTDSNGDIQVHKSDDQASVFIRKGKLCLPKKSGVAIFHTRAATQGDPTNPANNHPIRQGNFVGVHNGMIWNDDSIFRNLNGDNLRIGEVDSEAIWAAMMYGEVEPKKALEIVEGSAAVAWLHADDPYVLNLARANDSPLYLGLTDSGSAIFASTARAISEAAKIIDRKVGKIYDTDEGTLHKVFQGIITDIDHFEPPKSTYARRYYGWQPSRTIVPARSARAGSGELLSLTTGELFKPKPVAFLSTDLLDLERPTPVMDEATYKRFHGRREAGIEDTFKSIQAATEEDDQRIRTYLTYDLHALARPGTKVTTEVAGETRYGEIAKLPDEFGGGEYIIRVWLPIAAREMGWEAALVARTPVEFSEVVETPNKDEAEALLEVLADEEDEMTPEEFNLRVQELTGQFAATEVKQ